MKKQIGILGVGVMLLAGCSSLNQDKSTTSDMSSQSIVVQMQSTENNQNVGTVTITPYIQNGQVAGMLFTPHLSDIPGPNSYGFHVHTKPSCADGGMAAGGHWDPENTNHHLGPYNEGHLGDLPVLVVDSDGDATKPVLAPRIKSLDQLKGHSLMIHEGSDNYSDDPKPLGGGGARMWCGVIPN